MRFVFGNARAFDQPIGGWAVGRVRDFGYMLAGASSFNQNLGQWTVDPGAVTGGMLCGASALQKPTPRGPRPRLTTNRAEGRGPRARRGRPARRSCNGNTDV